MKDKIEGLENLYDILRSPLDYCIKMTYRQIEEMEKNLGNHTIFAHRTFEEIKKRIEQLEEISKDRSIVIQEIENKIEKIENLIIEALDLPREINSDDKPIGPTYGLTNKILNDLPIYKNGESIIPTKEDIDKHKPNVHITTIGAFGGGGSGASGKVIKKVKLWLNIYKSGNEISGFAHDTQEGAKIYKNSNGYVKTSEIEVEI